jgi:hypothetical protein
VLEQADFEVVFVFVVEVVVLEKEKISKGYFTHCIEVVWIL